MQPLQFKSSDHQLTITRPSGQSLVTQNAQPDSRPYLHPIAAPDGHGVLTEDAPPHHPWQHGLYVGLNGVNGLDFWKESRADPAVRGTLHPRPLAPARRHDDAVAWSVVTDWRGPASAQVLVETQAWSIRDKGSTVELDMAWTLTADHPVTFGQYVYGGLFLRMPFRPESAARALNSQGQDRAAAEQQRARWVAVQMLIPDRQGPAGIAILDHPGNPEHPAPWRVDNQFGFCPSRCILAPWRLDAGQSATTRYRVITFTGDIDPSALDASWSAFAAQR